MDTSDCYLRYFMVPTCRSCDRKISTLTTYFQSILMREISCSSCFSILSRQYSSAIQLTLSPFFNWQVRGRRQGARSFCKPLYFFIVTLHTDNGEGICPMDELVWEGVQPFLARERRFSGEKFQREDWNSKVSCLISSSMKGGVRGSCMGG